MAYSPAEFRARQQLAACCRVFHLLGWNELIHNQISVRVPGPNRHVLLNPAGLHLSEVTASSLVKVDAEGNVVGRAEWGVDAAAVARHGAIHEQVPLAQCVMQLHSTAGMAVAGSVQGLLPSGSAYAAQLGDRVGRHDLRGLGADAEDAAALARQVGERPAVLLRHRGLLAWGETLPKALRTLWTLQRACEVQVAGAALGAVAPIADAVLRRCAEDAFRDSQGPEFGVSEFEALVRLVDRSDGGWRD